MKIVTWKSTLIVFILAFFLGYREALVRTIKPFFQTNMHWLAIVGGIVITIILVLVIFIISRRIINEIMVRKIRAEVNRMNETVVEAKNLFIDEIKSGQVDSITCRLTYDPSKDRFNVRVANDALSQIISTWRAEENPKVLDQISLFAKGWVDYLAIYVNNEDLLYNLAKIIEFFLQEQILSEPEYGSLALILQTKLEEKIFSRSLI